MLEYTYCLLLRLDLVKSVIIKASISNLGSNVGRKMLLNVLEGKQDSGEAAMPVSIKYFHLSVY